MSDGAPSPAPPAATDPAGGQSPAATPETAAGALLPAEKTFTQADIDRIVTERLNRAQQSWERKLSEQNQKLAELFGGKPDEVDPVAALETSKNEAAASQQETAETRSQLHSAWAESLAQQAGIKAERVETFVRLVDLKAALGNVDPNDPAAVRAAIKSAVDAQVANYPEWKGAVLPASSGGDRQGGGSPSLDERLAAAVKAGNHREAISLKRQKAAQLAGGQ